MDDTDGFVYVALDEVDLSGMRNPRASIWVHLEGSNYEPTDAIRVWATTRLCGEIEIIRAPHLACHRWCLCIDMACAAAEGVLNDEAHPVSYDESGSEVRIEENSWQQHSASLAGCGSAVVQFGVQTEAAGEEVWFDMVEIRDV